MKHFVISMVLALLGLTALAAVQQKDAWSSSGVQATDRQFVLKAAEAGTAEVELGQLAATQASDNEVKQFGQQMVDDHSKANAELKDWVTKKGATLPAEPNAKQKQVKDHLSKLSGSEFDREFMRTMVKDHEQAVALFEKQSQTGRDPELKAWAAQKLPTLREHLDKARSLSSKVEGR